MRIILALLLLTITAAAYSSTNKKYGELGPRVSQAEFETNQQETLSILIPMLKEFESFKSIPSGDHDGTLTIGYGFTRNITRKSRITRPQADLLLQILAKTTLADVIDASPNLKTRHPSEQAAIADFAYNVGIGAYQRSAVKYHIDRGENEAAKQELKRWVHVRGRRFHGLVKRRNREIALLR